MTDIIKTDIINKDEQMVKGIKILKAMQGYEGKLRSKKRITIFNVCDGYELLRKENISDEKIESIFNYLIEENYIFKVINFGNSNNSNNGNEDPDSIVDISLTGEIGENDRFIWEKEDHKWIFILLFLIFILTIISGILTLYIPYWYTYILYYLKYPILAFLAFLLISGIIRWIVYLFTLLLFEYQLWIWPNLFADCGFFESFVPTIEWVKYGEEASEGNDEDKKNE